MLLILLIGWTILLPAVVVSGLYVTATVLGRRRAAQRARADQLAAEAFAEESIEQGATLMPFPAPVPSAAPAPVARLADRAAARAAAPSPERPPVGAGY